MVPEFCRSGRSAVKVVDAHDEFAGPGRPPPAMTEYMTDPTIQTRPAAPYVGIERSVTMSAISEVADQIPMLIGWLAARGLVPAGAPFLKYDVIDMAHRLVIEAGVPVPHAVQGHGEVFASELPAGRYVTVTHVGRPERLMDVTRNLLEWAAAGGLVFDHYDSEGGDVWASRLESYLTNPADEPDPARWVTEVAIKLVD